MITRRNWLLRCSILINIAVLLYICSQLMIDGGNVPITPSYIVHVNPEKQNLVRAESSSGNRPFNQLENEVREKPKRDDVPQQQVEEEQQQLHQMKDIVDNNGEDSRFEVPTEANVHGNKLLNEIVYQDLNLGSTNTTYSEGLLNDKELENRLRSVIKCHDRDYDAKTEQRGDFWVLKNYVRADHGEIHCYESITYTTHADYTFLDNLVPLLERWMAPISIALHAPGFDFSATINAIKYLRECSSEANLVRQFVTFHIYFSSKHIPKTVPKYDKVLETPFNCSNPPPFQNISYAQLYKTQKKLLYPVNVGRNIARDAALTHYFFASDIELYPNPGLVRKFLEMVARNDATMQRPKPKVYPLAIFEVDSSVNVPRDKTELQEQFRKGKIIPFHKKLCPSCHGLPKSKEWMAANDTEDLGVFHIGKRVGYYLHWEPIYIGTHDDPHYDERLSWEGKSDKMTQGYALCALDYEFHILDNAFLVHKPGIKVLKKDPKRAMLAAKTNQLIRKIIYPELQVMYGVRKGCAI
ncbi:beta-1,4-glucuronyltransferase 1 [Lutzomyia longipalpis]|uniref:beta-1,4-glucuronyltransferase 1 n=1 Tax=Lutzomyia longipalpis TaxID=7200 RepID=UPI002484537E|nr:beta-1,4-glucuronyltransferase 1 [Lutzomyia longipalpis]